MSNRDVAPRLRALDGRVTQLEGLTVQRYDIESQGNDIPDVTAWTDKDGDWVKYSDYTALAERLKACEDLVERHKIVNDMHLKNIENQSKVIEGLHADLQRLKAALVDSNNILESVKGDMREMCEAQLRDNQAALKEETP